MEGPAATYKIVVLGEARVGKTSLTVRFCQNTFDDKSKSTVNAACLDQLVRIQSPNGEGQKIYKLSIWDTAGQEVHHCLNTVYYRGAQGALIVYDITDTDSFQKMNQWVKELRQQLGNELPIIIAGNKSDLENNRQIPLKDAEGYAKSLNPPLDHFSASARSGQNVQEIFRQLTERIVQRQLKSKPKQQKINTRGGLNVKGLDPFMDQDSNDGGFGLRASLSKPQAKQKKKGCCK